MTVRITVEAEADLAEAFDYYEKKQGGVGVRFVEDFRRAVDLIAVQTRLYARFAGEHRRCRLTHFPYGILYRLSEADNAVFVVAIMHMARKPTRWKRRMQ